jgi:hypothetical protein
MSRLVLLAALLLVDLACRSPLAKVQPSADECTLDLTVKVEDHSRSLVRLKHPAGEVDTPVARKAALETLRAGFEEDLRAEAAARDLRLVPTSDLHLALTITSLGEVRTKYLVWGILSGVGWGVGVGLLAHNTRLALGLGLYELVEESAFWLGGSLLMGRWSSPAVVEARLTRTGVAQPLWKETYFVLWARKELAVFPAADQSLRERQLQASLRKVMTKLFHDLESIPGFPPAIRPRVPQEALPLAATAPALPPRE